MPLVTQLPPERPETLRPRVTVYAVPHRHPHPVSIRQMSRLGWLYGLGINGRTGTIRYGQPSTMTQRRKYGGYVRAPQIFLGQPRTAGTPRIPTPALSTSILPMGPGDQSPLVQAMATVTAARGGLDYNETMRGHG